MSWMNACAWEHIIGPMLLGPRERAAVTPEREQAYRDCLKLYDISAANEPK